MEKKELISILEKIVKNIMTPNSETIKAAKILMKLNGWEAAQPQVMVHVEPGAREADEFLNDIDAIDKEIEDDQKDDDDLN